MHLHVKRHICSISNAQSNHEMARLTDVVYGMRYWNLNPKEEVNSQICFN